MPPDGSSVTFRRVPDDLRRPIDRFARRLTTDLTKGRAFDCVITSDAELRRLNHRFRGEDHATDVLSFPALVGHALACPKHGRASSSMPHLGDLAISLTRARLQAREFGHGIEQEIHILMLHGVLHLLGMDHETDRGAMARAEKRWRARFGLPGGLIERVQS